MLTQLRSAEKMKRILWFGLLILIIPSMVAFYGFGTGDLGNAYRQSGAAATIHYPDGSEGKVGPTELRFAKNYLENRLTRYAQDQGVMLNDIAVTELTDSRALLDQAVNLDLLRHYAEANDLTVSMEEVNAFFQSMTTADQRRQLVEQWRMQGRSPESVLEDERKGRVLQKAAESIGAQVRVTHYEAWQDYLKTHESIIADYVRFSPSDFLSSVTVTDEGVKKYYEANSEKFRVQDQVQYDYVLLRKDDLKSSITVTDDEITSYYTSRIEDFRLPRKVEANQIFLKLPSPEELNTTSAAALTSITQSVSARANDLYERAAKGENFASLADTFSEEVNFPPRADEDTTATDTKTTAGGYLGLVSEDVTDTWYGNQWTSTVFSMKPDSITRPIRTPQGYGIVQVKRILEGAIQPLEEVRPIIESRIRDTKVEPLFEQLGEDLQQIAENVTTLEQIAQQSSTTIVTSPKVNRGEKFIPGIGLLGDLEEVVNDLQKGGRSDVLSDSQRHLVIEIKQEFPTHIPDLEEIKPRVEQAFKQSKAEEAAKAKAQELVGKSSDFASFQKALEDAGTTYTRSRPFTRPEAGSIFGGVVSNFEDETAALKPGSINLSTVGRPGQQQSFIVWHAAQVNEPSKTEFANDLENITQRLVERKREVMVLEYMRDQRLKLKDAIEIDENYM